MSNEKMSRESREAALERILAETASASEYRRPSRPVRQAAPVKETPKAKTEEKQMTEAEKAEAAKIRAAQKIAEIKKRKELEEQKAAMAAVKRAPQPVVRCEAEAEIAAEEIESVRPGVKVRKPKKLSNAQLLEENMQETVAFEEPEPSEGIDEAKPKTNVLQDILDIFECMISAAFAVILIFTYVLHIASVNGESMEPTLSSGDRLVVTALGYKPECGDIIVVNGENSHLMSEDGRVLTDIGLGKNIVKRIIATEGQTVDFDFENGIVYVDGKALEEDYISELTKRDEHAFTYPLTIPEGYVFVLGDNRNISKDSRHPDVGLVADEDIIGKALLRVYPFGDFGTVK